jgi:predicted NBD/HSP70 family sugar kinase
MRRGFVAWLDSSRELNAMNAETNGRPVDQRSVRRHNLALVMRQVADLGPRSRATIAAETGLNKTTVSSLVAELIDRRLFQETTIENPGAVGRPGRKVQLSGDGVAGVGLEVDEGQLAALATDLTGRTRFSEAVSLDTWASGPEDVILKLAALARKALSALDAQRLSPAGVTVALPGRVDITRGTLVNPNLGWEGVPVADLLRRHLDHPNFPLRIDNDANLGALGELWHGHGREGLRDFVYLHGKGRMGVGAGIIVDGRVFRGTRGFSGEIGHFVVSRRGPLCTCGNRGCLAAVAGALALLRAAKVPVDHIELRGIESPLEVLKERASAGDPDAIRALTEGGRVLSLALISTVNLLNPEAIVLGGWLASLEEWLVPVVQRELNAHAFAARWWKCPLVTSRLQGSAPLFGATALSLHEALTDPGSMELSQPVTAG